ncbi:putative protein kinase [Aspergillus affinis]|uniref:putative protein kinase n=1 Tax=Aspergillus affinis TaxID=1070780 RepID=UPI0022FE330C|nr:Cyclin-dependent kinase 12 [Aspergillus affinis]KAI9041738.1 Cyclin-dependent kinase 12 [Aspergillus affinis]
MAGSRRSPVLREQWRTTGDTRDQRDRERHRPRGSHRDRGGKHGNRDRDRRRRPPKDGRPGLPFRSPPPRSFPHPDDDERRPPRDFSPGAASARGSPGPSQSEIKHGQKPSFHRSPRQGEPSDLDHIRPREAERPTERDYRRDDSPSAPPPKRKRTRSPSPGGPPRHPSHPSHRYPGDDFDRGFPFKKRGRFPGRGRSGRRSPRRGRERRKNEGGRRPSSPRPRRSKSPIRGGKSFNPRRRFHSPRPEDDIEEGSRYRSVSRHSVQSGDSRFSYGSRRDSITMNPGRPARSMTDDSFRSPSPSRPVPSFNADYAPAPADGDALRESHGRRPSDAQGGQHSRPPRPHADSRQYSASPQYVTPTNSYHGSPQPKSPYSTGRGGWNGPQRSYHGQSGHTSPYRYAPTGPQSQYHQNSNSYNSGPSYRGGYRGNHHNHGGDRRFSGAGHSNYGNGPSPRGRGHFGSFSRGGSNARGRGSSHSPRAAYGPPSQSPPPPPPSDGQTPRDTNETGNVIEPPRNDTQPENENLNNVSETGALQPQPPSTHLTDTTTPSKGGKISFAFKAKTTQAPAPKPVPDLAQRMLAREPPPRAADPPPPRNRMSAAPPPKFKPESRFDRRDRDRDRHRERDRDRGRPDRRDYREPRGFREPRDGRDNRREDRRFDNRNERRRGDRRQDFRPERRRERTPEPKKQTKIMTRVKPRPNLPEEFAKSDSVYYRKPGNESVIGAGTYGKVFKAIHVYTQNKVALKKIRMEGEKDGFPVTAVREIKLLQHLRNYNVVSLLEVMVERNECFMVFEYLSHDLTGLINHPTFTLTPSHKKDLAKQMFEGLNYLHHRGVLHRDIKAANILISNRGLLKYADFGLARFFSKSRQLDYTNRVITIWYRPPELLLGETRYGPAVDVWSAACVYVEMFTKKAVFPGEGGEISQLEKLYNSLGTPTRVEWPDIAEMPWFELMRPTERKKRVFEEVYGSILSPAALDLVSQVFRYDPAKRPTAEEILKHPYFVSEEPAPQQAIDLENIEGDWHEFESKALRKEKDREARRAEYQKDKEKRKGAPSVPQSERDPKRVKSDAAEL